MHGADQRRAREKSRVISAVNGQYFFCQTKASGVQTMHRGAGQRGGLL